MGGIGTFFGAFYSARCYARLRHEATGYGASYSTVLFLLLTAAGISASYYRHPQGDHLIPQNIHEAVTLLGIFALAALLRLLMLLALAVAARLVALKKKQPMDYATGFRLAGAAYTPVAVADTASFVLKGSMVLHPLLLFTLGGAMLLAALRATR